MNKHMRRAMHQMDREQKRFERREARDLRLAREAVEIEEATMVLADLDTDAPAKWERGMAPTEARMNALHAEALIEHADRMLAEEVDNDWQDWQEERETFWDTEEYDNTSSNFLVDVSVTECLDEMSFGFTVHSGVTHRVQEPHVAGYIRVHELAKQVGITNDALVRHLRLSGEYVSTASSNVAVAVAERVLVNAEVLVAVYGARPAPQRDAVALLRERLTPINPYFRPLPFGVRR